MAHAQAEEKCIGQPLHMLFNRYWYFFKDKLLCIYISNRGWPLADPHPEFHFTIHHKTLDPPPVPTHYSYGHPTSTLFQYHNTCNSYPHLYPHWLWFLMPPAVVPSIVLPIYPAVHLPATQFPSVYMIISFLLCERQQMPWPVQICKHMVTIKYVGNSTFS